MSDKKEFIDLAALTEEQIANDQIENAELWMIKTKDGQMFGPYSTQSIKEYAADHQHLFEESMAYNLGNESWKAFFKIAKFQRRKPKLVPMQSLMSSDSFLILFNGEKKGPFTLEQVQKFVEDKKIALNVQVSLDAGESWIKLYEHHEFDRRLKKNADDLPFVPENNIFEHSEQVIQHKVQNRTKADDEEDAIVGLAFISNGNDKGQTVETESLELDHKPKKTNTTAKKVQFRQLTNKENFWSKITEKINFKYVGASMVGIFVLFTAYNSFNGSFNEDSEIKPAKKQVQTKQASINNDSRTPKKKVVRHAKAKPKKIARARKYEPKPQRSYRKRTRSRKPAQDRRRQVHTDDRYDNLDIDDPAVREELKREIAADGYGDNFDENLTPEQIEFIERANQEGFSEGDYDEMEQRDELYDQIDDFE